MTIEHVTTGFFEGETLDDLEKLILWELGQVSGTDVSYGRFPQWLIRKKLNHRQNDFVFQTHCITKMALVLAKLDYRQYKLPLLCMDKGVIAVKYYDTATSYVELKVVDKDFMNTEMEGYLTEDSGDPEYAFMGDAYGNIPMLEVHPAPDANGTSYTTSPDTGVTIGGDLPGATSNISGQATGGSASTLVDTATTFTSLGLVAGMSVQNVTDGSAAVIQSVAANTITFAANLSGGGDNTFSAGDSYLILAGEYGVLTSWANDDQYIFTSEVGLLSQITVPAGNFRVDFIPYPLQFPASGNSIQKPEIPRLYHQPLAMGVVADLLRTFHENTQEFKRAATYEAIYQAAVSQGMAGKESRPFKTKPVSIRPRFR